MKFIGSLPRKRGLKSVSFCRLHVLHVYCVAQDDRVPFNKMSSAELSQHRCQREIRHENRKNSPSTQKPLETFICNKRQRRLLERPTSAVNPLSKKTISPFGSAMLSELNLRCTRAYNNCLHSVFVCSRQNCK